MMIVEKATSIEALKPMAAKMFDNMVKAVVDVDRCVMAIDAEVHADLEALLLDAGSNQYHVWGINLYPGHAEREFVEFDSMINVRPTQGNRSRGVDDDAVRRKILAIVGQLVRR